MGIMSGTMPGKIIVITGSTRGIGFGLAEAFLARGCAVAVSGRTLESIQKAAAQLSDRYGADRILEQPCDVTRFLQVQALWVAARKRFGKIDIWINNAGIAHPLLPFWEHPPERVAAVIKTNLLGAMYGAQVALPGMLAQGSGFLYNMEGFGSSGGRMAKGMGLYGSTKAGLRFLTDELAHEMEGMPVRVGALRPGMVVTDMLTSQYEGRPEEWRRARRIFNILADRVETVAPWMAQKILENDQNGARISWTSTRKIFWRFLTAPFTKRDLFSS
jgi:NAD(P)-dependent dehydrogenase (short-subunit alcohol dehydrogenase family)